MATCTDLEQRIRGWVERHCKRLSRHKERYVRAWIAATGLHPTECELVEERTDTGLRWYVRRRTDVQ